MISEELKSTILKTLKLDNFDLTDETIATQVPGWDSLSHVNIILAVEKDFGIRFKNTEILRLKNVGDLQKLLDMKINK